MLAPMDEGNNAAGSAQDISQMSFEQALAALETIVQQLERGDVPLDHSISLYERGEALRAACQQRLDAAQARIEKIVTGADGRVGGTRPLDSDG
ncbi:exodeoxyribonuclease VII small subunit [Erythrobacter sanguineus]|uniref:Exodeoxyribonuclease 7 small subunit n=2 Tax=Erythrobacter sanguineus TaxID=198312 RepID=A0A1M7RSV7_9SPHN|nr:Exodeoxyribonuclease VII small subunit [Erythrobacter sanguineus]